MSSGAETTVGAGDASSKPLQSQTEILATGVIPTESRRTLEWEHIDLLKEKIAWLEQQLSDARDNQDNESHASQTTKGKGEDEEEKRILPEDKHSPDAGEESSTTRVRYIKRTKGPRTTPKDEIVTKESFAGKTIEIDDPGDDNEHQYALSWRQSWKKDAAGLGIEVGKPKLLIESPGLKAALKEVTQGHATVSFDTKEVRIRPPYEVVHHNAKALREYAKTNKACRAQTQEDIEILLREVENEPQQRLQLLDARKLTSKGDITFDLLWTLYYPGLLVYAPVSIGQESYDQVCVVSTVYAEADRDFSLGLLGIDYDGFHFTYSWQSVTIPGFKGSRAISELQAVPLEYYRNAKGSIEEAQTDENNAQRIMREKHLADLYEALKTRGKRFQELVIAKAGQKHFHYKGPMVSEGRLEMVVEAGQGEDISDIESSWTLSGKNEESTQDATAKENTSVMVDHEAFFCYGGKDPAVGQRPMRYHLCSCHPCLSLRKKYLGELPSETQTHPQLAENQFRFCSPRVLGFNIKQKEWAQMLVDQVEDIKKDGSRDAWEKLEMADASKKLLENLVGQHDKMVAYVSDLVPGKGNGLITLLHGPPGVGKTLTAESLAMLTARPLYSLSMSDVGSKPSIVEQNLLRVFELATHWRALLLFDEADVFLEKRSLGDLHRNGLVSVFIRLLEYYHGILFLTTNRIRTFDEAFQSRIQVAIEYEDLSQDQCKRIWANWLDKAGSDAQKEEILLKLDEDQDNLKLNGRQIRNTFRCAVALAKSEGSYHKLAWPHMEKALKTTIKFKTHMQQTNKQAEREGLRWATN